MKKELWLSRDDTVAGHYNVGDEEPTFSSRYQGMYKNCAFSIAAKRFHKIFPGQSLRKGRKRKIKRILIELED